MVKSRLIAGVSAILLALVGALLIFSYAGNADDRAMTDLEPVAVLVVQKSVPIGTSAEDLVEYVAVAQRPKSAVAPTALKDLKSSAGKVTSVELVPGEQLLAERLVDPGTLRSSTAVEVPKGLQEISFQLEPQRAAGGRIVPGEHVGIFISLDSGALEEHPNEPTTHFKLHKKLVTAVQRAPLPTTDDPEKDAQALPEGSLLITVAVDGADAASIVFATEFGRIWLSKEPLEAKETKSTVIQKTELYR